MGRLCYPTQAPGSVLVPRVLGARKLSRCKEGMAWFLPSVYKFCELYECRGTRLIDGRQIVPVDVVGKQHWRSVAVQIVSEAENCHDVVILLRAVARTLSGAKGGCQVRYWSR